MCPHSQVTIWLLWTLYDYHRYEHHFDGINAGYLNEIELWYVKPCPPLLLVFLVTEQKF
jgi:hypothetical protein